VYVKRDKRIGLRELGKQIANRILIQAIRKIARKEFIVRCMAFENRK